MAVSNVACPYCGAETLVTVPEAGSGQLLKLKRVVRNNRYTEFGKTTNHAACRCCNESFGVLFS